MNSRLLSSEYTYLSKTLPAIKGLAILTIVIFHLCGYTKKWPGFEQVIQVAKGGSLGNFVDSLLLTICLLGEHAVHFFLIASGFGLTASWWQKQQPTDKQSSILTFWQRRLSRIFPLYWFAHGLALILVFLQPKWTTSLGKAIFNQSPTEVIIAIIASLTTLRDFIFQPEYFWFLNGAWWYIGLTVQLYLIFPLLIHLGKNFGWSRLLAGTLLLSLLYRTLIVILPLNNFTTDVLLKGAVFPSRLFEFVFGAVLAIALLEQNSLQEKSHSNSLVIWSKRLLLESRWMGVNLTLWFAGIACHFISSPDWIFPQIPADALVGVGEFCFVFQLLKLLPWFNPLLKLVGNYSYGIYLTHMTLLLGVWSVLAPLSSSYWLCFGMVTGITCFLGGMIEFFYEKFSQRIYLAKT